MTRCPKCERYNDDRRQQEQDKLGVGHFCNARRVDKEGPYGSTAAAEGHSGCHCSYMEADVKLDCCQLVCSHSEDPQDLRGKCQDFEPSAELRKKFGLK